MGQVCEPAVRSGLIVGDNTQTGSCQVLKVSRGIGQWSVVDWLVQRRMVQ